MASDYAERYGLSAEEEGWRARAEAFARDEVALVAREADRAGKFPARLLPRLAALGFLGTPLPREHGGSGANAMSAALVAEEIGRVDGTVRGFLAVDVGLVAQTIADFGTTEQKAAWLPRLVAGTAIGCFAMTEPGAGSDAGAISTRAWESNGEVAIEGEKHWITNGRMAHLALLFANADPAAGKKGIECYLVPTDTVGYSTEPMDGKELGHRASDHARVILRGVRVPASARLGPPRSGFKIAMAGLDHGRLNVAAGAVGIQAACLDACVSFARSRRQFGQRIGDFQQVGARLADMRLALETSRLLVHHAARTIDRGRAATAETSAAKLYCTERALETATHAVRLHGARGYSDALPLERHYRDAIGLTIYEGTSEIQRLIIARGLLGKDDAPAGRREP